MGVREEGRDAECRRLAEDGPRSVAVRPGYANRGGVHSCKQGRVCVRWRWFDFLVERGQYKLEFHTKKETARNSTTIGTSADIRRSQEMPNKKLSPSSQKALSLELTITLEILVGSLTHIQPKLCTAT